MKSILIVNSGIGLGGGEAISNSLASALSREFSCVSWFSGVGAASDGLKKIGVQIVIASGSPIFSIRSLIKNRDFDYIHAQGTRAAFWVKWAILFCRKRPKIIYTLHGIHFARKNYLYRKLFGFFEKVTNYLLVDALVCVGGSDLNLAKKLKLISEKRLHLIKNGIDVALYHDMPKNNPEMVIGTICRLEPPKEVGILIDALDKITFKCKLVIIGDGSLRSDLERRAIKSRQEIVFMGFQNNIPALLSQIDVFVLSSKWEGLPISLLEAMAASRPLLGSNVSGIRELIRNGENGFLFENVDDLAAKLVIMKDEKLREVLGENGRRLVVANYSIERTIKEYKTLYESLGGK